MREGTIYVEPSLLWFFARIVHAHNKGLGDAMAKPLTIDSLCNDILLQYVKTNHPKLIEIYERREALNDEALTALNQKKL